jgi:hypothetical protein
MVSLIPSRQGIPKTQFIFLRLLSSPDNSPSSNVSYLLLFIYHWHCVVQISISQSFIHGETSKTTFHIPKNPYLWKRVQAKKKAYRGSLSVATGEAFLSKYDKRNTHTVHLRQVFRTRCAKFLGVILQYKTTKYPFLN